MAGSGAVWVRRGGVLLAVLLVLAVALSVIQAVRGSLDEEKSTTREFDAKALVLDLRESDVRVRSGDVERVRLTRVERGDPDVTERLDGGTLRVDTRCPALSLKRCSVDYQLVVPKDVPVQIGVDSGDADVDGVAVVRVDAGSGNIDVAGATSVWAHADSGNVTVSGASGRLDLAADSGDVTATGLTSTVVKTDTDSGDVDLRFARAPDRVDAGADSGNVTVRVPKGTSYRVDATIESGSREVEVPTDPASAHRIRVHADSGDVAVRTP